MRERFRGTYVITVRNRAVYVSTDNLPTMAPVDTPVALARQREIPANSDKPRNSNRRAAAEGAASDCLAGRNIALDE
jgi:hypothetical protein